MTPYPLTKELARMALSTNADRIPWNEPDKIVVDRTIIGGERQVATLLDLLCAAYDLKPKESVSKEIYIKPCPL
jgi:hypothetical protein